MSEKSALLHVEMQHLGSKYTTDNHFSTNYSIVHLVFDLLLPSCLGIVLSVIALMKFPVRELGFFCDDESIRYPYHDSTVKSYELYLILVPTVLFIIILTLVEHFSYIYARKRLQTLAPTRHIQVKLNCIIRSYELPFWLWKFSFVLYALVVGHLVSMVVVYSLKLSVGELRPHFIDVCNPNFSITPCRNMGGSPLYVTNYTCTGEPALVREARLSFPSGHSSFITYNMAFLIFYLETKQYLPTGLRTFFSIFFGLIACIISITRLDDFKHHSHDVLAGMAIGVLTAIFTYFYLMRFNVENKQEGKDRSKAYTKV